MSVETITLGCRLNFAESETIARSAPAQEDWIIVNSCAVTNEALRQTRQEIRRAHRRRPDAKILVTGCAAELEPSSFSAMAGVSRVVGNAGKVGDGVEAAQVIQLNIAHVLAKDGNLQRPAGGESAVLVEATVQPRDLVPTLQEHGCQDVSDITVVASQ